MPPETIFRSVTVRFGPNEAEVAALWAELETRYNEPHRHYHRLTHIAAMLADAEALGADDPSLLLAIFYHDAIYDPTRRDNEAQSADLFRERFTGRIDYGLCAQVCAMIEATQSHKPTDHPLTDLLLDLDMAILGAAWPHYLSYAEGVAKEYIPVFGNEAYRAGRANLFLTPVLKQPRIFLTPAFADRDAAARENLMRELKALE